MYWCLDIWLGVGIFLYWRCNWFKHRYSIDVPISSPDQADTNYR